MADIGNALLEKDFGITPTLSPAQKKALAQKRRRMRSRTLKEPKFKILNPEESREMEWFLLRVVLEVLAFTYSVDPFALEAALGERSHIMQSAPQEHGRLSLLSHVEKLDAYRLGEVVAKACAKSGKGYNDDEECHKLFTNVLLPAQNGDIYPDYFFDKLMEFRSHRCLPGHEKETMLYAEASSISVFGHELVSKKWRSEKQQMYLAHCLTADEIVLGKIDLPAEAKTLIAEAISRFGRKHCKSGMRKLSQKKQGHEKDGSASMALVEEIWEWYWGLEAPPDQLSMPMPGREPAMPRVDEEVEPAELPDQGKRAKTSMDVGRDGLPVRPHTTLGERVDREDERLLKRQGNLDSFNLLDACASGGSWSRIRPRSQSVVSHRYIVTRPRRDDSMWP